MPLLSTFATIVMFQSYMTLHDRQRATLMTIMNASNGKRIQPAAEVAVALAANKQKRQMRSLHSPRKDKQVASNADSDRLFLTEIEAHRRALSSRLPTVCSSPEHQHNLHCESPRVPNIQHVVWLYGTEYRFTFRQLLSGLSIVHILKPCVILFWYDGYLPAGNNWQQFQVIITCYIYIYYGHNATDLGECSNNHYSLSHKI